MTATPFHVRLDLPCQVPWEVMTGNDAVRFCTQCNLHVHNLSAMTDAEARAFLATRGERLCVAYLRQADGSAALASDTPGRGAARSLPVISYETPRKRPRWMVPAALAGAVVTAGAAAALKPKAVQAVLPPAVAPAVMVAGGIAPPVPVAFDPSNPATPLACAVKGSSLSIRDYARYDRGAAALMDGLPPGIELLDLRHYVHPTGTPTAWGQAYVLGVPASGGSPHEVRAVLWVLPAGTKIASPDATADAPAVPRFAATVDQQRELFVECDDPELSRRLAELMAASERTDS